MRGNVVTGVRVWPGDAVYVRVLHDFVVGGGGGARDGGEADAVGEEVRGAIGKFFCFCFCFNEYMETKAERGIVCDCERAREKKRI